MVIYGKEALLLIDAVECEGVRHAVDNDRHFNDVCVHPCSYALQTRPIYGAHYALMQNRLTYKTKVEFWDT